MSSASLRLNEYYLKDGMALQKAIRASRARKEGFNWPSSSSSTRLDFTLSNAESAPNETVVILDWKLDTQITSMEQISQQVAFLLSEYRTLAMKNTTSDVESTIVPTLEVVINLETPGGSVADYGLAGQHLLRLRNEPDVTLTICVDKCAASGGYLLCCTASEGQLFASPFALLGSIGVIATQINVHKLLHHWGIQPIVFRGGKDKAPVGVIGEITKDGKRITQAMIDDTHRAFKQHVVKNRPVLKNNIEEIGKGSVWLGIDALDLNLVDAIKTSDEYIEERIRDGAQVFKMIKPVRSGFLLRPRFDHLNFASKKSVMNDPLSASEDVTRGLMPRLPAHINSLFSKPLKFFQ